MTRLTEKEFERSGFLPDIVFPTGLVRRQDHLLVYYGAADTATGVAQYSLSDLAASVTPQSHDSGRGITNALS